MDKQVEIKSHRRIFLRPPTTRLDIRYENPCRVLDMSCLLGEDRGWETGRIGSGKSAGDGWGKAGRWEF